MENVYDDLGRLTQKLYTATDGSDYSPATTYSYMDWSSDTSRTTGTVRGIDYSYTSGDLSVSDLYYVYDANGNITAERTWQPDENNPLREKYTYDGKNQLIRHDSATQGKSFAYEYDAGGNILSKSEYDYTTGELGAALNTVSYTYGDASWGDLLTAYNGEAISYDTIGNPTSYLGWNMTWQGRQLASASKDGKSLSFTYDSEGIRTSKTVDGVKTEYLLNGTQILAQKTGSNTLCFFYDQQGNRVGMADSSNHFYYYLYNLQGDVIAIADASTGKLAATYTYDAWGKIVKINGIDPDSVAESSIAKINPFRYRGYYYDTETGFYYLNSRYYSPEFGRFISADGLIDNRGATSQNLFAYCHNNPVNYSDADGHLPKWLFGALDIASGITQILAGAAMITATAATGVGIAAGIAMALNGVATIISGGTQIYNYAKGTNAAHEENWIRTGAKALGNAIAGEKGQKTAEVIYDIADLVSTVCSIGGGVKAIGQTASKVAKTTSLQKYAFTAGTKSMFYNVFSSQRALSPLKEIVTLPKPWIRITNMVGAGIDAVRTTANNIIPLFN